MHVVPSQKASSPAYQRRTRAQWQEIIRDWGESALTQRDYCTQHGIALSSFYKWRQKLSTQTDSDSPDEVAGEAGFVNVFSGASQEMTESAGVWRIELDFGDVTLRLSRG